MNYYPFHIGDSRERARAARALRSQRMANARSMGTHTEGEWEEKVSRYGGRCVRCGRLPHRVEKDHIKPIYQGGSDAIHNLQPLCARCNRSKGPETTDWAAYRDAHGFPEEVSP